MNTTMRPTAGDESNETKTTTGVRTHTFTFDVEQQRQSERTALKDWIGSEYYAFDVANESTVQAAYDEMVRVNEPLFEAIPVDVEFTDSDPYESYEEMCKEVGRTRTMKIFAGGSHPEYITPEENRKARAVHDWYGHMAMGVDFSLEGEWAKWNGMRHHYGKATQRLLFTEVVGQLCAASVVGGFDADDFEQRGIIAPQEWIERSEHYMRVFSPYYDGE